MLERGGISSMKMALWKDGVISRKVHPKGGSK
jgi:hypothetical protein